MTSTMERNKKSLNTLAFCLGILLVGGLIQAAGWLKGDKLVFPGVGEILQAHFFYFCPLKMAANLQWKVKAKPSDWRPS